MNSKNSDEQELEPDLEDTHELNEQEQIIQLNKVIYESNLQLNYVRALVNTLETKVSILESQMNQVQALDIPNMRMSIISNHSELNTSLDYLSSRVDDNKSDIQNLDSDVHILQTEASLIASRMSDAERDIDNTQEELLEIKAIIREIQNSLFDRVNYKSISFK